MTFARTGVASLVLAVAVLVTACAGSPAAAPTTVATSGSGVPSSPVATPESTTSPAAAAEPTCETIISETTVKDFADLGWTVQEGPLIIAEVQLEGGLECKWGDSSIASGNVQVFGWAPITLDQAATARDDLLASGWRVVEEAGSVFITESADTAVETDEDGYGLTYLLGDGWVKLADTKQGLLLVEWPRE